MNKEKMFKPLEQIIKNLDNIDDYTINGGYIKEYPKAIQETIDHNLDLYIDKTNKILVTFYIIFTFLAAISLTNFYFFPLMIIPYILSRKMIMDAKNICEDNMKKIDDYKSIINNKFDDKIKSISKIISIKKVMNKDIEKKYEKAKCFIDKYINGTIEDVDIDKETLKMMTEILKEELNTEENNILLLLKEIKDFYENKDYDIKSLSLKNK